MEDFQFYKFLKVARRNRRISLRELSAGICTVSMLQRVENGERHLDWMVRNRIVGRLGINSEDFEDYVHNDEYVIYELQMKLVAAIESQNMIEAELARDNYAKKITSKDRVQRQFLADMDARIAKMKNEPWICIKEIYENALRYTIPELSAEVVSGMLLAPVEYFLFARFLEAWSQCDIENAEKKLIAEWYEVLIAHNLCANQESAMKSRTLPLLLVEEYRFAQKYEEVELNLENWWKNSEAAINYSREGRRIINVLPLLKCRNHAVHILRQRYESMVLYDGEKSWENAIQDIYEYYGVEADSYYNCLIYRDATVLSIGKVMSSRRKMIGMTKDALADGICDVRTIARVENGSTRIQMDVVYPLMERLSLYPDFRRMKIISEDEDTISLMRKLSIALNQADLEAVKRMHQDLLTRLDVNSNFNMQIMSYIAAGIAIRSKDDVEHILEILQSGIEKTLQIRLEEISGEYFFSQEEILCIYLMFYVTRGNSEKNEVYREILKNYCKNGKVYTLKNPLTELILLALASTLGNEGEYNSSNLISTAVAKWALERGRISSIHVSRYYQMRNDQRCNTLSRDERKTILQQCVALSDFSKDARDNHSYLTKLNMCN